MGKTSIEWADWTWNPWYNCTEVSPACDHCYARLLMQDRYGKVKWGAGQPRVRTKTWGDPIRWNRAAAAGKVETVFCLSLGDIWDNEVDPLWRHQAFDVMRNTPNLLYLLLSKRIGNAISMCDVSRHGSSAALPENAALGATMINQEEWDRDLPKLLHAGEALGAKFTFASVEPMLGPINMSKVDDAPHWVIVGGESGADARPMDPDWARSLRDQCAAANVPFHFKQWGANVPDAERAGHYRKVSKKSAGRLLDGVEHNGMPV